MKMKKTLLVGLCALSFGVIAAHGRQVNENDLPNVGSLSLGGGGVGQIFGAPTGNAWVLDDFSFYLQNTSGMDENLVFYLLNWNVPSSPILWQSSVQTVSASDTGLTPFTVNPDYTLPAGNTGYLMLISELGLNGGNYGGVNFAVSSPGIFIYFANANTPSDFTGPENNSGAFIGLAMTYNADFTSVPDSGSSMLLLSFGFGGIAAMRRWWVAAPSA
jgi:hypothetical protein